MKPRVQFPISLKGPRASSRLSDQVELPKSYHFMSRMAGESLLCTSTRGLAVLSSLKLYR